MSNFNSITIVSNGDSITFVPADYKIEFSSLSGSDSGRAISGQMHVSWILRKVTKLEVTLPAHKVNDSRYYRLFSLIQGQVVNVTYYDYIKKARTTKSMYCSETSAGYSYCGIVEGATFELIDMNGEATVTHISSTQYTITVLAGSGGTASGGGTYYGGSEVEIVASPNSGYSFSGWNDGNTTNPRTVTVNSNKTYTASFIRTPVSWTIAFGNSLTFYVDDDEGFDVMGSSVAFNFVCNNTNCTGIDVSSESQMDFTGISGYVYDDYEGSGWTSSAYKTITTTTNPTSLDSHWQNFLNYNATITPNY